MPFQLPEYEEAFRLAVRGIARRPDVPTEAEKARVRLTAAGAATLRRRLMLDATAEFPSLLVDPYGRWDG